MNVEESYKYWSEQYDTNENKTRDLEAVSLRETLKDVRFEHCLEIGCGTGKNTEWLITQGRKITAVDLSKEMLNIAQRKITNQQVTFLHADITQEWTFANAAFDLVVCSLVLEHIENLDRIFSLISRHLTKGGTLYIGELHPFKQYSGSKASYETEHGKQIVTCFTHHISEFTGLASKYGLMMAEVKEYFDEGDKTTIPRILTLRFIQGQDEKANR